MESACLPVGKHTTYDQAQAMRGDVSEMSVEQYMSFVRDEAQSLPLVGRVEHVEETIQHHQQSLYMPTVEKVDECDPTFLPDEVWVSETLYTFSELRRTISQMAEHQGNKERVVKVPPMKHRKSWKQFCFGVAPVTMTKEAKGTRTVEDDMLTQRPLHGDRSPATDCPERAKTQRGGGGFGRKMCPLAL